MKDSLSKSFESFQALAYYRKFEICLKGALRSRVYDIQYNSHISIIEDSPKLIFNISFSLLQNHYFNSIPISMSNYMWVTLTSAHYLIQTSPLGL